MRPRNYSGLYVLQFSVITALRTSNAYHIFAPMTAAQEVQAILDRKGWTQYELAKRAKLPRSTIKRIVDGGAALSTTMDKIRGAAKGKSK